MDYRDNRQRWAESHQVVHFYAGQWCTFTPALTECPAAPRTGKGHKKVAGPKVRPRPDAPQRLGGYLEKMGWCKVVQIIILRQLNGTA